MSAVTREENQEETSKENGIRIGIRMTTGTMTVGHGMNRIGTLSGLVLLTIGLVTGLGSITIGVIGLRTGPGTLKIGGHLRPK